MLWKSCDALRGGMDASKNKDYDFFIISSFAELYR